jgi:proteasome lid subunit RPN8/RPN11
MSAAFQFLAQFPDAMNEARSHARRVFPEESCGVIVNGQYHALENKAQDPSQHQPDNRDCPCRLCAFAISDEDYLAHCDDLDAIVHSHPYGPAYPSKADMLHQEQTDVAWIIIPLDESRFANEIVWGGKCPTEPLIGRTFVHGVSDCYSAIRDTFALGKDKLAEIGIEWPHPPIQLPLYPRSDAWWEDDEDNFYEEKPSKIGFVDVSSNEVRPGDVFLGKIRSKRLNHGGVLLGNNLILHHLPNRLSRREPAGLWMNCAEKWIRYKGPENE